VLAHAVAYTGHTAEGRAVTVQVRGRAVIGIRASLARYTCETFGDVGPLAASGRFRFVAGEPAQRVTVTGTVRRGGRLSGHLQVRGSIATGQRCASLTLRFTAQR
jgi:hypothetical protein